MHLSYMHVFPEFKSLGPLCDLCGYSIKSQKYALKSHKHAT